MDLMPIIASAFGVVLTFVLGLQLWMVKRVSALIQWMESKNWECKDHWTYSKETERKVNDAISGLRYLEGKSNGNSRKKT